MTINPYLRDMLRRDLPEVLGIEEANNGNPWREKDFCRFMQDNMHGNRGIVAEYREQVLGFMLYQVFPKETSLVELSVTHNYKRRGVATALLDNLVEEALVNGYKRIVYLSMESNLQSQLFLREQGFSCVRILHDYYDDISDDVYEMELKTLVCLNNRMSLGSDLIQSESQ